MDCDCSFVFADSGFGTNTAREAVITWNDDVRKHCCGNDWEVQPLHLVEKDSTLVAAVRLCVHDPSQILWRHCCGAW